MAVSPAAGMFSLESFRKPNRLLLSFFRNSSSIALSNSSFGLFKFCFELAASITFSALIFLRALWLKFRIVWFKYREGVENLRGVSLRSTLLAFLSPLARLSSAVSPSFFCPIRGMNAPLLSGIHPDNGATGDQRLFYRLVQLKRNELLLRSSGKSLHSPDESVRHLPLRRLGN